MNDESNIFAGITILSIALPLIAPVAILFFLRRRIPACRQPCPSAMPSFPGSLAINGSEFPSACSSA